MHRQEERRPIIKAIRIHAYGGLEQLRYEDIEVGEPGPGEALVRHACRVN